MLIGAKDILMEAHFLSAVSHKHILHLRGVCAAGVGGIAQTGRADGFFLIFDRLEETLGKRITTWRHKSKEAKSAGTKTYQKMRINYSLDNVFAVE